MTPRGIVIAAIASAVLTVATLAVWATKHVRIELRVRDRPAAEAPAER